MSKDEFILHDWEWEKIAELKEAEEKLYYENMLKEGVEKGIKQGIEQDIEKNTISTIQNMLKKNLDYNLISNITKKSIKEIKEIESKLK